MIAATVRRLPVRGTPWLITFVDLVGLLLAFFVLQFAMTSIDQARMQAMFGTAGADAPPIAGERADRDAILGAAPLAEMTDPGYFAAVLRDRLKGSGLPEVAVTPTRSGVLIEIVRMAPDADAATANAAALAALEPVLDLLRRVPAHIAVRVAVADPAAELDWRSALRRAEALVADLVADGFAAALEPIAVAGPGNAPLSLLVEDSPEAPR